ncbi:hypothetical protein TARUN_8237 [Trichoderma arundinaceum]|uniref:Uncharacterized protein n=1 Tax=Trichoderma arundinaceum TaxID=490622 RepID=A0A395NDG2_TRIAR|nr:hypothetical protein TARUN_8237 [Trichoderma arundinaceum]
MRATIGRRPGAEILRSSSLRCQALFVRLNPAGPGFGILYGVAMRHGTEAGVMARRLVLFATAAAAWLATLSSAASSSSTSTSKTSAKPSPTPKCYYPNGKPEQNFNYNYQPCGGRNTTWQQCCIPGQDVCTENGLCTHMTNEVAGAYDYRAGCTNADWSGCPQVCLDVLSNSWLQVKQCATGEYCCNPDFDHGDCCRDGSRRFNLLDHNPDAKNTTGVGKGDGDPVKKNGTDTSGGGSNKSGGDDGSNKNDNNNTTQTDDGKADEGKSSNTGTVVGAAVGGTVGGLALIGAAVGLWLYLRKRTAARESGIEIYRDGTDAGSPGTVQSLGLKQAYTPVSDNGHAYTPVSEMEARPVVAEMDTSTRVHELGA